MSAAMKKRVTGTQDVSYKMGLLIESILSNPYYSDLSSTNLFSKIFLPIKFLSGVHDYVILWRELRSTECEKQTL